MPQLIPQQLGKVLYEVTQGLKGKELDHALVLFMKLVHKQQMGRKMDYILSAYERVVAERKGHLPVTIISAMPLSDAEAARIAKAHGGVDPNVIVDESLIGGIRVQVGNTVLDASIKEQIRQLHAAVT